MSVLKPLPNTSAVPASGTLRSEQLVDLMYGALDKETKARDQVGSRHTQQLSSGSFELSWGAPSTGSGEKINVQAAA